MNTPPIPPYVNVRESLHSSRKVTEYMSAVFGNSLGDTYPQIEQPASIKLPLRQHQRTGAAGLKIHEERMLAGITQADASGATYYTRGNGGIYGDPVGSGKSLTVLSYIAHLKENPPADPILRTSHIMNGSRTGYTIHTTTHDRSDPKNCKNLVVVPYSIIPQWRQYVATQTTLSAHIVKTRADISTNLVPIQNADLTIVSNTMFAQLMSEVNGAGLWWERVFYDEADSIKISGGTERPVSIFNWYITASWQNMVLFNVGIHRELIETIVNGRNLDALNPELVNWLAEYLHNYTSYYVAHHRFQSHTYFPHISHLERINSYINIIRCSAAYYRHSFQMPAVHYITHRCRRSAVNNALRGLVDPAVQELIDADDIHGALGVLNINSNSAASLLKAVEHRYLRDISNIQLTITYREAMEYMSAAHKEEAIATLRRSKERVETQLQTFRERIAGIAEELCPICYDPPASVIYTPCCSHMYCASCILKCMRLNGQCPMCRTRLRTDQLVHVAEQPAPLVVQDAGPPRKSAVLLRLLKENPGEKVLVFSNYDNPFVALADDCEQAQIKYKIIKGNSNSINKSIADFEKGKIQVLFMNSRELGVGLNIVAATHVVLYHALRPEDEKQVVGRALRMGRTAPLTVHKLLHEGEVGY